MPRQIVGAFKWGTKMENNPENSMVNSFKFFHMVFDYGEFDASLMKMMYYSVNDTGILGKKSDCFYQESNLRPSDY